MKFLCVPCDRPMKIDETREDRGSIAVTYGCPDCGYEFAMLTNPMETQVVSSLGIKIGAEGSTAGSKCPFTGVVQGMGQTTRDDGIPWTPEALARMDRVPDFVKPMVKTGIEKFARDAGHSRVDEKVLEQAKSFLGAE